MTKPPNERFMRFPPVSSHIAVAAALTLSACASAPPATEAPAAAPLTAEVVRADLPEAGLPLAWQDLFDHARQLVELRSSTSLEGLELHVVDNTVINAEVDRETRRLVNAQFSNAAYAERFVERIMDAQSGTYLALYSAVNDAVLVSRQLLEHFLRGINNESVAQRAVLALFIHEAVHAADDRRHDINSVRTLDFRAAFAQSAIFEGHAQWQTRKLCAIAGCQDGLEALDQFMFGGAGPNQAAQSSNALSRNVIEYAYVEGERFIDSLASRNSGEQTLEKLLADPPVDPVQILDPGSWPDNSREQRNKNLLSSIESQQHPWNGDGFERIQTSPLKGVNLRADPSRRAAAVDGFTRLLTAMAAMEVHAVSDDQRAPVDITVLEGESATTALLFARTLHANNLTHVDATETGTQHDGDTTLYSTARRNQDGRHAHTLVGVSGRYIIQLASLGSDQTDSADYARGALQQLTAFNAASLEVPVVTGLRSR